MKISGQYFYLNTDKSLRIIYKDPLLNEDIIRIVGISYRLNTFIYPYVIEYDSISTAIYVQLEYLSVKSL